MDLGLSINNKSNKCTMCEVIFIENVLSKLKLCFNFALDFSSVFQYFHSICLHFWHVKDSAIRDAFKKKKKFMTNVILGGAILKIFTSVLTFQGGQKIFFLQKCPKSGLVS